MISKKECIAIFPKRLDLMKSRVSLAFKETGSAPDIYGKLPFQRVRNLHYQRSSVRSNKATRS